MKNKKAFLFLAMALIVSLTGIYTITAANSYEGAAFSNIVSVTDSTDAKEYTCPMHPEVISDKPGECPKCGMTLELKEEDPKKDDDKNDEKKDEKEHDHKSGGKHDGHDHSGCKHKGC
jgi:hypothetical protein